MKKILYALTGVSMLALTAQVSAMTETNTWERLNAGTSENLHTSTTESHGTIIGTNSSENEHAFSSSDAGNDTSTGVDVDPFVGPGGIQPIDGGEVEFVRS